MIRIFCFFIAIICFYPMPGFSQVENLTILAFGDSITQGLARAYDSEGNVIEWGNLDAPLGSRTEFWGYPIELEKRIESDLQMDLGLPKKVSASIYNWGHHGWTSTAALECEDRPDNCIDTVLASRVADFILILFGSNDLYNGISSATTKFNLEQLILKSLESGVEPIIGTITPNTDSQAFFYMSGVEEIYNEEIRNLAEKQKVLLADHYKAMVLEWESKWTSGDGLHLGQEGNEKMAETWYLSLIQSKIFTKHALEPILYLLRIH